MLLIRRLLLVLAATILALALAEVFIRVFYECPWYGYVGRLPQEGFFEYDATRGWRGVANASKQFAATDFDVHVTHNGEGRRTTGVPHAEGKTNIIILGDSYGWGHGVEDAEVFAEVMMQRDERLNTYNLSAPGYGTDQQWIDLTAFLQQHPEVRPRHVVLVFSGNDFDDNTAPNRYGYPKPFFRPTASGLKLANTPVPKRPAEMEKRAAQPLVRRSRGFLRSIHLYNLVVEMWRRYRLRLPPPRPEVSPEEEDYKLRVTIALLKKVDATCRSIGARLHVVLLFPSVDWPWARSRTLKLLTEAEIRHSEFHASSFRRTRLWMDTHLNAHGQSLLAYHVLEVLGEGGPDGSE